MNSVELSLQVLVDLKMVKILFLSFFAFVAQCCGVTQPIIRNTQAEGCIGDKCGMICSWEDVKLFPGETLLYRPGKCHKLYCTFGFDIRMTACSFDTSPVWIVKPGDARIVEGSNATVECKADGLPQPQVLWKKGVDVDSLLYTPPDKVWGLTEDDTNVRVENGTLIFENIQKANEGYYLCTAKNGIEPDISTIIYIYVRGYPKFSLEVKNQTARYGESAVLHCEATGDYPIDLRWYKDKVPLTYEAE
ncbi:CLUMA_CG018090, isoform A [Clunio marinus]|uniref:CLUMA_CG018090, isoform A n=1 Tax=Clunio marinus TaxID=568069 RepID=A0A1J1IZQ9_9DIPT|nr:CLUMA_CG018090, isoform A [Clunio marinus]